MKWHGRSRFCEQVESTSTLPAARVCALLVVFLGLSGCSRHEEAAVHPEPQPTLLSDLRLTNGCLHQIGQSDAFSGYMVEKYPDGSLKSRSVVSNGVLWGLSEGWHTNGNLQVREFFASGVSDGVRTKWETNGVKLSEAVIVGGKLNGPFRRWHSNGSLSEQVDMKDGIPDRVARTWYPSGCPKAEMRMVSGRIVEQKNWADGDLPAALFTAAKVP